MEKCGTESELEQVAPGVWVREIPRGWRPPSREFVEQIISLSGSREFEKTIRQALQLAEAEKCLELLKGYFRVCSHLVERTIFPNDGYDDVYPMRDLNKETHAFLIEIGEIDPAEEEEGEKGLEKIGRESGEVPGSAG